MKNVNTPKIAVIALLVLFAGTALLIGRIDFTEFMAATGPAWYLIGNGVAAKTGDRVLPAFGRQSSRED